MNDIFARRAAYGTMHHHAMRMTPVLWRATQVTKEPLDHRFLDEEFMRVNGHRRLHPLLPSAQKQALPRSHWNDLNDTCTWAESGRAQAVRFHTPLVQRFGEVGLLSDSLARVKTAATVQNLMMEQLSRTEGVLVADKSIEVVDDEPAPAAAEAEPEKLENTDEAK